MPPESPEGKHNFLGKWYSIVLYSSYWIWICIVKRSYYVRDRNWYLIDWDVFEFRFVTIIHLPRWLLLLSYTYVVYCCCHSMTIYTCHSRFIHQSGFHHGSSFMIVSSFDIQDRWICYGLEWTSIYSRAVIVHLWCVSAVRSFVFS